MSVCIKHINATVMLFLNAEIRRAYAHSTTWCKTWSVSYSHSLDFTSKL